MGQIVNCVDLKRINQQIMFVIPNSTTIKYGTGVRNSILKILIKPLLSVDPMICLTHNKINCMVAVVVYQKLRWDLLCAKCVIILYS